MNGCAAKLRQRAVLFGCAILVQAILPTAGHAQTSASDWFQKGLNATAVDEKIQSFERATQLDPNYVEAFFYLGLAYKAKNMTAEAELAFNKAYFTNPYALNNEIKCRILFELGLMHQARGKTREAIDALKGAKELAGNNRQMRGKIAFELGKLYFDGDMFPQALSELEDSRSLLPQNRAEISQLVDQIENKRSVDTLYQKGISLLGNERYQQAIETFDQVIQIDPNFRDVQTKREQAVASLASSRQNQKLNATYERALSAMESGNNSEAISLLQQVLAEDASFRDAAGQLRRLQARTTTRPRQTVDRPASASPAPSRKNETEQAYQSGLLAFNQKKWQDALRYFSEVQRGDRNYKDVQRLIQQTNQNEKAGRQETQLDELYNDGVARATASDWKGALDAFRELERLSPGYRDVSEQLQKIKDAVTRQTARVDTLYQLGLSEIQNRNWAQAMAAFEEVRSLSPTYKDVRNQLEYARRQLDQGHTVAEIATPASGSSSFIWMGASVILLIIPVAGVLYFFPTVRARIYVLQGQYIQAAEFYEKYLEKRPEKVKFYPVLANIYLLENRRDKQAIRIFEMVLKLNILTPRRTEINSIVANYYLTEGRTDKNAIKIMERELNNKIQKLQSGAA